jgi:hypothetical protein
VYADERINADIRSLSILCVGGRGQPMLAGMSGGGGVEPKKSTNQKGEPLAIYSFYKYFILSHF